MEGQRHSGYLIRVVSANYRPSSNMSGAQVFFLADFPKLSWRDEQKGILSVALNNARLSVPLKPAQLRAYSPSHWEDKQITPSIMQLEKFHQMSEKSAGMKRKPKPLLESVTKGKTFPGTGLLKKPRRYLLGAKVSQTVARELR